MPMGQDPGREGAVRGQFRDLEVQLDPDELHKIRDAVLAPVREHFHDLVVALAVSVYILHLGKIIGEEMEASISFPSFPPEEAVKERVRELFHSEGVHDDPRVETALSLLADLRLRVSATALPQASPTAVNGDGDEAREDSADRLFAALLARPQERSAQQTAALLQALSEIADKSTGEADDLALWDPGLAAVSRIARLVVSQALPAAVGTVERLEQADRALQVIATLGGAVFLKRSIKILVRKDPESPYAALGLKLIESTEGYEGREEIQRAAAESEELDDYINGLITFTEQEDSVFAIEHPFHFRVLLEVLSGENRRYPAEPVLNVEALTRVWGRAELWDHFAWSREQLPVVANELRHGSRAVTFVQHYAAFGRTPLTSSFARLSYQTRATLRPASWLRWPSAFEDYRERPVTNEPNMVAEVHRGIRRQQSLGRLWRGVPGELDLRWLGAQLLAWDGRPVRDDDLAGRIWDSSAWLGYLFPVDLLSEIRTAAWLLEALRLRLKSTVLPVGWQERRLTDADRKQVKEAQELCVVLEIMSSFTTAYLTSMGDGIPGLGASLERLGRESWFMDLGSEMRSRLENLENHVADAAAGLASEVQQAIAALGEERAVTLRGGRN